MLVTAEVGTCVLEEVPVPWDMQVFQQLIPASVQICEKQLTYLSPSSSFAGQEWDKHTSPRVDTVVLGKDSLQALPPCQGLAPCKCSVSAGGVMRALNHAALCLSVSLSPCTACEPPKSKDSCLCAGLTYSGYLVDVDLVPGGCRTTLLCGSRFPRAGVSPCSQHLDSTSQCLHRVPARMLSSSPVLCRPTPASAPHLYSAGP